MATIAPVFRTPATPASRDVRVTFALLALLTLTLRVPDLGNPLLDVDDTFYRYVGRRMAEGAIPYVDVWDRKPIGLFLIYRFIDALGGDPFVTGQVAAMLCAFATAATLAVMAWSLSDAAAGPHAGFAAGATYLVWIELLGGRVGQSPVFYNLPVALAAWAVMRAWRERNDRAAFRCGLAAMLLCGLALQIKPTAVFEGVGFGLLLIADRYRRDPRVPRLIGRGALLALVALAPTALAFAGYAAMGHGQAWWFANVESIFLRSPVPGESPFARLSGHAIVLAVPFVGALLGLARLGRGERLIPGLWLATATAGVLAIPPYFNHYMLPLIAPLAVLGGVATARSRPFAILMLVASASFLLMMGLPSPAATAGARTKVARLTAVVTAHADGGCAFAFGATPLLNLTSGACAPTRYAFGMHLSSVREAGAIGVDPLTEVRRVLATRPPVIVTAEGIADRYAPTTDLVDAALVRDYRPAAREAGYLVYVRR